MDSSPKTSSGKKVDFDTKAVQTDDSIRHNWLRSYIFRADLLVQCFVVGVLNLGQMMIGFGLGYSATFLPHLQMYGIADDVELVAGSVHLSTQEGSWITSVLSLGQVLGSICIGFGGNFLGRKALVLASCLPNLLGWLTLFLAPTFPFLVLGRFLTGFGMGMEGAIHTVYVGELVNPAWAGAMASSGVMTITCGILLAFVLGTFVHWRQLALVFAAFPVVMSVLMVFVPESPIHLAKQGKVDKARVNLRWLHLPSDVVDLDAEIPNEMATLTFMERLRANVQPYLTWNVLKPVLIVNGIFTLANFSGFIVVIFYGVSIFQESSPAVDGYVATITIGLVQVLGSLLGTIIIYKVGNRILLLSSSLGSFICMTSLGLTMLVRDRHPEYDFLQWLPLLWLILFTLAFTIGLAPVPWVLMGAMFPENVRSTCAGFTASLFFISLFLAAWAFPHMASSSVLGMSGTFGICGLFSGLAVVFTLLFIPGPDQSSSSTPRTTQKPRRERYSNFSLLFTPALASAARSERGQCTLDANSRAKTYFDNGAYDPKAEITDINFEAERMAEPMAKFLTFQRKKRDRDGALGEDLPWSKNTSFTHQDLKEKDHWSYLTPEQILRAEAEKLGMTYKKSELAGP